MKHHYFFAVELPKEAKDFLNKWVELRKRKWPFERWVHPQDFHITLAFLGFAKKEQLDEAIKAIEQLREQHSIFTLTFSSTGTFGSKNRPRIFWAGVEPSKALQNLREDVFIECERIGFELDQKPFHPHITIARKWGSNKPYEEDGERIMNQGDSFSFTVKNVVLYRTDLDKTPKYFPYAVFPLKNN